MIRGSRKHVLDWTDRPDFPRSIVELVKPVHIRLTAESRWMPQGHDAPAEARLETFGPKLVESNAWQDLRQWWLRHERGANTPNWDLAVGCEIDGRTGLVLVEAKANERELSVSKKP